WSRNGVSRIVTRQKKGRLLAALALDIADGVADGANFLGVFIGDFDAEFFFEGHDELDDVERVGAKIVDEGGLLSHLFLVHAKLGDDAFFDLICNGRHGQSSLRERLKMCVFVGLAGERSSYSPTEGPDVATGWKRPQAKKSRGVCRLKSGQPWKSVRLGSLESGRLRDFSHFRIVNRRTSF